jgi:hypothetical protein
VDAFTFIYQVGFPIASAVGVAFAYYAMDKRNRDESSKRETQSMDREQKLQNMVTQTSDLNKALTFTNQELAKSLPDIARKLDFLIALDGSRKGA